MPKEVLFGNLERPNKNRAKFDYFVRRDDGNGYRIMLVNPLPAGKSAIPVLAVKDGKQIIIACIIVDGNTKSDKRLFQSTWDEAKKLERKTRYPVKLFNSKEALQKWLNE